MSEENGANLGTVGYKRIATRNSETGRKVQTLQCLQCRKKFSKLCNMQDHLRIHMGVKPFSCKWCGMLFSQRGNRDRHYTRRACLKD